MRRITILLLGATLLSLAACGEREGDRNFDYLEYSYVDTVFAADTIRNNDLVRIVHVYPEGSNHFEQIETKEHGDTLDVAALYNFYFIGIPNAHGSGLDTTSCRLLFSSSGAHYLSYRRSDKIKIVQPVYVSE